MADGHTDAKLPESMDDTEGTPIFMLDTEGPAHLQCRASERSNALCHLSGGSTTLCTQEWIADGEARSLVHVHVGASRGVLQRTSPPMAYTTCA